MKPTDDTHAMDPAVIAAALEASGVSISREQAQLIAAHADLVLATNVTMNLTRITSPDAVVTLHIVDSLAFLPRIAPLIGPVVDIGSGAGYPGIPLRIAGVDVALCESVGKKARFLESCVDALGLSADVFPVRAEELALSHPRAWSAVVARAVSSLASLVELASPLLARGGRLVALKGAPTEEELRLGERAAEQCGMGFVERRTYELPGGEKRSVIVYESQGSPQLQLPRRPGLAQRSPLGS